MTQNEKNIIFALRHNMVQWSKKTLHLDNFHVFNACLHSQRYDHPEIWTKIGLEIGRQCTWALAIMIYLPGVITERKTKKGWKMFASKNHRYATTDTMKKMQTKIPVVPCGKMQLQSVPWWVHFATLIHICTSSSSRWSVLQGWSYGFERESQPSGQGIRAKPVIKPTISGQCFSFIIPF